MACERGGEKRCERRGVRVRARCRIMRLHLALPQPWSIGATSVPPEPSARVTRTEISQPAAHSGGLASKEQLAYTTPPVDTLRSAGDSRHVPYGGSWY